MSVNQKDHRGRIVSEIDDKDNYWAKEKQSNGVVTEYRYYKKNHGYGRENPEKDLSRMRVPQVETSKQITPATTPERPTRRALRRAARHGG